MCIAYPGEIIDITDTNAKVNVMGVETNVNVQLIAEPQIGDYVLVHAGCAIEKIDQSYFTEVNHIFEVYKDREDMLYDGPYN
jgi:hydrogenase expression/formation protein HypC